MVAQSSGDACGVVEVVVPDDLHRGDTFTVITDGGAEFSVACPEGLLPAAPNSEPTGHFLLPGAAPSGTTPEPPGELARGPAFEVGAAVRVPPIGRTCLDGPAHVDGQVKRVYTGFGGIMYTVVLASGETRTLEARDVHSADDLDLECMQRTISSLSKVLLAVAADARVRVRTPSPPEQPRGERIYTRRARAA